MANILARNDYNALLEAIENVCEKRNQNVTTTICKTLDATMYPSKIIVNYPMTICVWPDGTKTYSKSDATDDWNPNFAILNCMIKKYIGHGATARLHDIFEAVETLGNNNGTIFFKPDGHVKKDGVKRHD